MSDFVLLPEILIRKSVFAPYVSQTVIAAPSIGNDPNLAAFITKTASKQTYYTIRFLVDHHRVMNAYRAYAYFRWVDDMLDEELSSKADRTAFLKRQEQLISCGYANKPFGPISAEESLLTSLIQSHPQPGTGLELYIRNMMAVMAFDAERRGRLISEQELSDYSQHLAIAVTEALHYFIGHDDPSPQTPTRYCAVLGAHITHMLRDAVEDTAAGYFNVPREFINAYQLDPCDIKNPAYREWARSRVQLARTCFVTGKNDIAHIQNFRRRIAGYAYISRFEQVLRIIENDNFQLRADYSARKSLSSGLRMGRSILSMMFTDRMRGEL